MLTKTPIITVIPGVAGRAAREASSECVAAPPPGTGGDGSPPPPAPLPGDTSIPAGTVILLEDTDGLGGYFSSLSIAPAPVGFVCRYQAGTAYSVSVYDPASGDIPVAIQYNYVCTRE